MLVQFKHAFRHQFGQRLFALGATILLPVGFGVANLLGVLGPGMSIFGVTLSAFSLAAIMVVSIIANVSLIRTVFSAPQGYLVMQAPVAPVKILVPRLLVMTLMDLFSYIVAITAIVVQSNMLQTGYASSMGIIGHYYSFQLSYIWDWVTGALYLFGGYLLLLSAIVFCVALSKTYFYRMKGRVILSMIATVAVIYLLSWTQLLLAPFGTLTIDKFNFDIYLTSLQSVGGLLLILLTYLQVAVLIAVSAGMMKRRMNL